MSDQQPEHLKGGINHNNAAGSNKYFFRLQAHSDKESLQGESSTHSPSSAQNVWDARVDRRVFSE